MSDSRPIIAHVLHRLDLAGAEVLAAGLAQQLGERCRFIFLCLDGVGTLGEQLTREGFPILSLDRRPGIDLRAAWRLRKALRRHRVDLLHAHQYTPFFYAALARGWRGCPPILFTEHGRHYPDHRRFKRVVANRLLLRRADRVTAVCDFVRRMLAQNEGINPHRIEVIPNGIDPAAFASGDRAAARAAMGLGDHDRAVLHVARFHPVKDHETAIRAFAMVLKQLPQARLVLIGDGERRPIMQRLAAELELGDRVRFLGVRRDVAQLIHGADVLMLSSLSEGASVTLLEAMAAKLPVVATEVGGNPELVEHNRNGLLSPRRDPAALAHHLLKLLSDPDLRRRMGQAGYDLLQERFTQARMHESYARLYEQMTGKTTSPTPT